MQFEFEGDVYRIGFQHPVPTYLAYHAGHEMVLARQEEDKNGHPRGWTRLFCAECEARVGHVVQLVPRGEDRIIGCAVLVRGSQENTKPEWILIASGFSRLNRKAKDPVTGKPDQYTREGGRRAALKDALSRGVNAEFRVAALAAYENRKAARIGA